VYRYTSALIIDYARGFQRWKQTNLALDVDQAFRFFEVPKYSQMFFDTGGPFSKGNYFSIRSGREYERLRFMASQVDAS